MKKIKITRYGKYVNCIPEGHMALENWIRNNVQPTEEFASTNSAKNTIDIFKENMTKGELIIEAGKKGYTFQWVTVPVK